MSVAPKRWLSKAALSSTLCLDICSIQDTFTHTNRSRDPSQETQKSYTELREENRALSARLAQLEVEPLRAEGARVHSMHRGESQLYALLNNYCRRKTVACDTDVRLPPASVRQSLLAHGGKWTSWLYFSFDFAIFEAECDVFELEQRNSPFTLAAEPSWLALWFAFLTVSCTACRA